MVVTVLKATCVLFGFEENWENFPQTWKIWRAEPNVGNKLPKHEEMRQFLATYGEIFPSSWLCIPNGSSFFNEF